MRMLLVCLLVAPLVRADEPVQSFATDPNWDALRNRLLPTDPKSTRQDFGWRDSNKAGGRKPGEIGGRVQRSLTPASYAKVIPEKTFNDKLTASGVLAVTAAEKSSGVLLGWFHDTSRGWRTPNSVALRLDGNGDKFWVLFEYGTRLGRAGSGATFEGKYQTTKTKPEPADGKPHRWALTYDPAGHGGDGELIFVWDGKTYSAPLVPGHKKDGAVFNRFGLWNPHTAGKGIEVYVDDLELDGRSESFDADPKWTGVGNHATFNDPAQRPLHDFGFSKTNYAGGEVGEIGGRAWRDMEPAYYADRVGPFNLDQELTASGRIVLRTAASDSGVYLGWFDSELKRTQKTEKKGMPKPRGLLGVHVEGPSREGYYFAPEYRTADGRGACAASGPHLVPTAKRSQFTIHYDPNGAGGNGRIKVTLDREEVTLDLAPGDRKAGATFDRFGLFDVQTGGHYVELYLDDLKYTRR
jgi:hypothetical protein